MKMIKGETLRERQARTVRAELRAAFVRLVAEQGLEAVSLAEVADAAGVSERTLYRHYPNRDILLEAILEEDVGALDREVRERGGPYSLADPDAFVTMYEVWEEHADLMTLGRLLRLAGQDRQASAGRTDVLRRAFEGHVHPDALDQVVAIGRVLAGADAWLRMREPDVALDTERAGHAVQWALQVITEAAAEADGPLVPRADDEVSDVLRNLRGDSHVAHDPSPEEEP
jgi:AcrR family transcriptional regulator